MGRKVRSLKPVDRHLYVRLRESGIRTGTRAGYCPGSDRSVASAVRRTVRCPACRRRLLLAELRCSGGELSGYRVPPHKARVTRGAGPRRQSRAAGRGK